jgi:hypothetical protein
LGVSLKVPFESERGTSGEMGACTVDTTAGGIDVAVGAGDLQLSVMTAITKQSNTLISKTTFSTDAFSFLILPESTLEEYNTISHIKSAQYNKAARQSRASTITRVELTA